MDYNTFYPRTVKEALEKDPPGAWMPILPDGCIRLSAGYPAPDLVPSSQIIESTQRLIGSERDLPLQYLGSPKMASLRIQLQARLADRGMQVGADQLLVTSGAAQAIDLIARTLLDDETPILVEAPTYMEALEMFRNYTSHIFQFPVDNDGLQIDRLESWLTDRQRTGQTMPRLLYTIPSFHNPTGSTLTQERRKALLALADRFNFLIVEDDAYGELYFDGAPIPLKAMDQSGRVIHVGSLSKVVAPGLRVGWIAAAEALVAAFGWFKKDLEHPFAEAVAATYLTQVDFGERLDALRVAYRNRRDGMIRSLERCMPDHVTWRVPQGGFFVWLRVEGVDTARMLSRALQAGVAYVPGKHFFQQPEGGLEYLRLSYSYLPADTIVEGVQILASVIRESETKSI